MCFIVLTIVCTLHCYCGLPLDTCGQWTVHVMHACLWSTLSTVSGYGIGLRWSGIMAIRSTLTKGHSTTQRHSWEHHHLNKHRKNCESCHAQVTWKAKFKCYAIILHLDRSITGDPQTSTGDDNEVTGDGLLGKGAQKRKMEIFHDLRIRVAPPSFYWHFFPSIFFTP